MPPVVGLPINVADVAAAMYEDAAACMPFGSCFAYCSIFLTQAGGSLAAANFMASLPPHHRGRADEILGVALSLATARNQGYMFWGSRPRANALLGGQFWSKPWKGDGPDHLCAGPNDFALIEVKGRATAAKHKPTAFVKHKVQSVNARLNAPVIGALVLPPIRYLLSYAYLPADPVPAPLVNSCVQWFNATRKGDPDSPVAAMLRCALALVQFETQVRNAGHQPDRLIDLEVNLDVFTGERNYVLERQATLGYAMGITIDAIELFRDIKVLFANSASRPQPRISSEFQELSSKLALLSRSIPRKVRWREHLVPPAYRFSTGVFVVGRGMRFA